MVDIKTYIPPVFHDVKEVQNICDSISKELNRLLGYLNDTYNNQYFDTMDAETCLRWENMMKLQFDSTYTLQERRDRIKSRFIEQLPYTKKSLDSILKAICGDDGYELEIDDSQYLVNVKLAIANKNTFSDVAYTIGRILPATMFLEVLVMYNSHELLSQFTHSELSAYTHEQLRSEVLEEGA